MNLWILCTAFALGFTLSPVDHQRSTVNPAAML
jgi:hypothetical protein